MITPELQKIDRSIRLLQSIQKITPPHEQIEVAYSGGKDSDVILQLAKEAGINYRAIYKNTTIDPPGTVKHARDMGAEVVMPKESFFRLVEKMGFPNRFTRFCCGYLKEYKVLNKSIMGIRRDESRARKDRYTEPTACRYYKRSKKPENRVEAIYPILEWTTEDVEAFVLDRGIKLAPVYYDEDGTLHTERRLGCICCPLASNKKRLAQFHQYPNIIKGYIRAGKKYRQTHTHTKAYSMYGSVYEWFVRDIFYESQASWDADKKPENDAEYYKRKIEQEFNITLE